MMSSEAPIRLAGRVNRYYSNFYYVTIMDDGPLQGKEVQAMARGLLRKQGIEVLAGDRVWLQDWHQDTGWIVAVEPRRNQLERPKIANVDQALVVMPWRQPVFDKRQLDKTLTQIALHNLPAALAITKADLADTEADQAALLATIAQYQALGYTVFALSTSPLAETMPTTTGQLAALRQWMTGAQSVLAGVSGAGKSSLLNRLNPALDLRVKEVSAKIERGQHTTRTVTLLEVLPKAWVADTPGFSLTKLTGYDPLQVEAVFTEFAPWRGACGYKNCLHQHEAGCAVSGAVQAEQLDPDRYTHYRELVAEAEADTKLRHSFGKKEAACKQMSNRKGQGAAQVSITRLTSKQRATSRRKDTQTVVQDRHHHKPDES